jgi:restriction system protein
LAKRRRRKKEDPIETLLGLAALGAAFLGFKITNSLAGAAVGFVLVLGIFIAVQMQRQKHLQERLRRSGIEDIDKMDGRQFEHYLGLLFKSQGYSVDVTRSSGDFGADLVISKNGKKIVVQAKRYSSNVGLKAVQEAQTAIGYYKATEAWVVANRGYSKQARELAKSNNVKLIDREQLIDMVLQMNPGAVPSAATVISDLSYEPKKCKMCGSMMVVRKGSRGEFWGCSSYPKCHHKQSMTS